MQLPLEENFGERRPARRRISASILRAEPQDVREPLDDAAVVGQAAPKHTVFDNYSFRTV